MSPQSPHIIREFDEAIRYLRGEVIAMADQSQLNLERAVQGLVKREVDYCKAVIADDSDVDEYQRSIDSTGMDILVRFHPVATDLRLVISSMKIAANLERISDHAVGIAKRVKKILKLVEFPEANYVEPLYEVASSLLRDAVSAFRDNDATLGASLGVRDKELDRRYKKVSALMSDRMGEDGSSVEGYLHLIFILRSLERIGDLAVNIGEDSVFLTVAQDIRHGHSLDTPDSEGA